MPASASIAVNRLESSRYIAEMCCVVEESENLFPQRTNWHLSHVLRAQESAKKLAALMNEEIASDLLLLVRIADAAIYYSHDD